MKTLEQVETVGEILDRLPEPRATLPAVAATPMQMLQIAVEKGASIETLERLLALQERWEANEARKAFVAALSAFKSDPPTVVKDKSANFGAGKTAYDYATLDQVAAVIGAALSRHGLSHRWETAQADGKIKVTCVLTHDMGHSERVSLEAGADASGSKNAIQAIGSTVTYLQRYTLLAATGLAAKDQDDDAHGTTAAQGFVTTEQIAELHELIVATTTDLGKFLAYICPGARGLAEIPASKFPAAKAALAKKART